MTNPADFKPNFRTPEADFSKEEINKRGSNGMRGTLYGDLRDGKPDLSWESEQLAKSYGFYLEFNRALTGDEKDWIYLIRVSIPGGGPLSSEKWLLLDELSERYGVSPDQGPTLRLTTRQNIQFHWVKKEGLLPLISGLAKSGLWTLNGCGDNVRNTMACPLSRHSTLFDGNLWAKKTADFFRLPMAPFLEIFALDPAYERSEGDKFSYGPQLLNRKFKIAFSNLILNEVRGKWEPDNCVELRTNDMGIAPLEHGGRVESFQIYLGGGQGERNGKPTTAALGVPFAVVPEDRLLKVMDAVVQVHQEWGDRQNRHWARLKYVIRAQGVDWFRQQVEGRLGFNLQGPDETHDIGPRHLHHGWHVQPDNGYLSRGVFVENGRLTDGGRNGKLKSMVRALMLEFPVTVSITPNQDLLFSDIPPHAKEAFEARLASFGNGTRNGKPFSKLRTLSGACVGRETCRLAYTDSEQFEPELLDKLEALGWGNMTESIGITGCERQCFRPATKTIGLVGSGKNRYLFKLMGDEEGRNQGIPLYSEDKTQIYLHSVPRDNVGDVVDSLFRFYKGSGRVGESMGQFHRRVGASAILDWLRADPNAAEWVKSPKSAGSVF